MWTSHTLTVNGIMFCYQVKHYPEPSKYGIDGGRISKLSITSKDVVVVAYDRGWDIEPHTEEEKAALMVVKNLYN